MTSGSIAKARRRSSRVSFSGVISASRTSPRERLFDVGGDPLSAPQFVLLALEGARDEDRVEREAVGRGEDLSVDDIAAGCGAGAGDAGQEPRVVGRDHGDRGHAAETVGRHFGRERAHVGGHRVQELGVGDLPRRLHLQPIGRVVAQRVGLELRIRPAGQRAAQRLLRGRDTRLAVDRGMAAAENDLGLPIKRPQQLTLPAVQDARGRPRGCRRRSASQAS